MSAQTTSTTERVQPPDRPSRSTALIVLVAPTVEDRADFLAQLDPSAPVLIVPSVPAAQRLMEPELPGVRPRTEALASRQGTEPGATARPVSGVRVHEDRQAVGFGTAEVSLTPLEFALLRLLIREPGRVWRFDELVRRVWGTEHLGDASQVHAVVKRLRAKLTRERVPVAIEAVRGVGFRAVRRPVAPHGRSLSQTPSR